MYEQPQQPVQGQTTQPSAQPQMPQGPQQSNLQGTVDNQSLESSGSSIQIPGSSGDTSTQQTAAVQATAEDGGFFTDIHIGTGLLVAVFILAFSLILTLARLAQRNSLSASTNIQAEPEPSMPNGNNNLEADAPNTSDKSTIASKKYKSNKKLTRRQRRKQKL